MDFLAEVLQRLSQLASDFHFIREIEINPFFASADPASSSAVDARIRLDF
jgi:succinyl-CoA synthetase beta subunit